jgi:hypothetical protein
VPNGAEGDVEWWVVPPFVAAIVLIGVGNYFAMDESD